MKIIASIIITLSIALIVPLHDINSNLSITNDLILMFENFSNEFLKESAKFEAQKYSYYEITTQEVGESLKYLVFTFLSNLINKISMIILVIGLIILRIERGLIRSIIDALKIKIMAILFIQALLYLSY